MKKIRVIEKGDPTLPGELPKYCKGLGFSSIKSHKMAIENWMQGSEYSFKYIDPNKVEKENELQRLAEMRKLTLDEYQAILQGTIDDIEPYFTDRGWGEINSKLVKSQIKDLFMSMAEKNKKVWIAEAGPLFQSTINGISLKDNNVEGTSFSIVGLYSKVPITRNITFDYEYTYDATLEFKLRIAVKLFNTEHHKTLLNKFFSIKSKPKLKGFIPDEESISRRIRVDVDRYRENILTIDRLTRFNTYNSDLYQLNTACKEIEKKIKWYNSGAYTYLNNFLSDHGLRNIDKFPKIISESGHVFSEDDLYKASDIMKYVYKNQGNTEENKRSSRRNPDGVYPCNALSNNIIEYKQNDRRIISIEHSLNYWLTPLYSTHGIQPWLDVGVGYLISIIQEKIKSHGTPEESLLRLVLSWPAESTEIPISNDKNVNTTVNEQNRFFDIKKLSQSINGLSQERLEECYAYWKNEIKPKFEKTLEYKLNNL